MKGTEIFVVLFTIIKGVQSLQGSEGLWRSNEQGALAGYDHSFVFEIDVFDDLILTSINIETIHTGHISVYISNNVKDNNINHDEISEIKWILIYTNSNEIAYSEYTETQTLLNEEAYFFFFGLKFDGSNTTQSINDKKIINIELEQNQDQEKQRFQRVFSHSGMMELALYYKTANSNPFLFDPPMIISNPLYTQSSNQLDDPFDSSTFEDKPIARKNFPTVNEGGFYNTFGAMFDIMTSAKSYILVESFDIHTSSKSNVTCVVWTRQGSFKDDSANQDTSPWELVAHVNIKANGKGATSSIPREHFNSVYIEGNAKQAFYITLTTKELICTHDTGTFNADIWKKNEDISFLVGVPVEQYPSQMQANSKVVWNGVIYYAIVPPKFSSLTHEVLYTSPSPIHHLVDSPSTTSNCTKANLTLATDSQFFGTSMNYGNMFVIKSKLDSIVIKSLDIIIGSEHSVAFEIFTKSGPYYGHETIQDEWTKIAFGEVIGKGSSQATSIPTNLFEPVSVDQASVQSFYVSLNVPALVYDEGESEGIPFVYDEYMDILEGNALNASPFSAGRIISPTRWQGNIHFDAFGKCVVNIGSSLSSLDSTSVKRSEPPSQILSSSPTMQPILTNVITGTPSLTPIVQERTMIPTYISLNDQFNYITTVMVLNVAADTEKIMQESKLFDIVKGQVDQNLNTLLQNNPSLISGSPESIPFKLFPTECRPRYISRNSNLKNNDGCVENSKHTCTRNFSVFITISHPDTISVNEMKNNIYTSAPNMMTGIDVPIVYKGPWTLSDKVVLTIFLDKMTQVKTTKLFRYIENNLIDFLSKHLMKSDPYLTLTTIHADGMDSRETSSLHTYREVQKVRARHHKVRYTARKLFVAVTEETQFGAEIKLTIKAISKINVDLSEVIGTVFEDHNVEFEDSLKSSAKFAILGVSVSSSSFEVVKEPETFYPIEEEEQENFFLSKTALMIYIETLVVFIFVFACIKIRKARKNNKDLPDRMTSINYSMVPKSFQRKQKRRFEAIRRHSLELKNRVPESVEVNLDECSISTFSMGSLKRRASDLMQKISNRKTLEEKKMHRSGRLSSTKLGSSRENLLRAKRKENLKKKGAKAIKRLSLTKHDIAQKGSKAVKRLSLTKQDCHNIAKKGSKVAKRLSLTKNDLSKIKKSGFKAVKRLSLSKKRYKEMKEKGVKAMKRLSLSKKKSLEVVEGQASVSFQIRDDDDDFSFELSTTTDEENEGKESKTNKKIVAERIKTPDDERTIHKSNSTSSVVASKHHPARMSRLQSM